MGSIFDDDIEDGNEEEVSEHSQSLSIFHDIEGGIGRRESAQVQIDRRTGETSSIFGNVVEKKKNEIHPNMEIVDESYTEDAEPIKPQKMASVDKFNAAAAKRNKVVPVDDGASTQGMQGGKRVLQPRTRKVVEPMVAAAPKEISVTEAVKSATHDVAVRQSAKRAEVARQRAEQLRTERPVERARAERPLPERQTKKRAKVGYNVVDEIRSSRPGSGAGFLRRTVVGMLNGIKCKGIERKFKNAKEFKCKPFKFKVVNGEAMITSYSGDSRVVEFPSYIRAKSGEEIPVCYIHSSCLYNNIFSNYRTKNAIDNLTSIDSSFKLNGQNKIIDIKLPEGLKAIFDDTFDNCMDISALTIPSTVQFIGNHAFRGSTISKLFFNGPPISNWTSDLFPGMHVYVAEQYADLY